MIRAWTKRILVGCMLAGSYACVVSVDDDLDEVGGASGSSNTSGSGGTSGASGAGAQGGSSGSMSMIGNGGMGGTDAAPTPVCTAEAGDAQDPCLSCIKTECCTEWRACTDSSCQQEREDLEECVLSLEDPPEPETYGDCVSMVSTTGDFLQENTQTLFECVNEVVMLPDAGGDKTRCGTECFGVDIFFD